jgi:hypothetical protein
VEALSSSLVDVVGVGISVRRVGVTESVSSLGTVTVDGFGVELKAVSSDVLDAMTTEPPRSVSAEGPEVTVASIPDATTVARIELPSEVEGPSIFAMCEADTANEVDTEEASSDALELIIDSEVCTAGSTDVNCGALWVSELRVVAATLIPLGMASSWLVIESGKVVIEAIVGLLDASLADVPI